MKMQRLSLNGLENVKLLLEKDANEEIEIRLPYNRYIWFSKDETDLYLKCLNDSLIISRIQLKNRRKGIATKIFNDLKSYAQQNGYNYIVMESTLTPEVNYFCSKHGFEPDKNYGFLGQDGLIYGNYIYKLGGK